MDKARVEAQSFRLTLDEQISVDALTRYIAGGFAWLLVCSFMAASH